MERTKKAVKQSLWWANDTWVAFAIDKDVRSSMMLVNIKLFTSTSQIKVFAFHRMMCIHLNSTNQPNVNGGVVTMNPKWQVMVLNPCIRTRNNIWEQYHPPSKRQCTIFMHVCIVEGVLSKLNPQVEKSVPKSPKITHTNNEPF